MNHEIRWNQGFLICRTEKIGELCLQMPPSMS